MTPDPQTELAREFARFLCRHLVVLCAEYEALVDGEPHGEPHVSFVSGFVLEVDDIWCFATAGHILQDERELGDSVRRGRIRVNAWSLVDYFGPQPLVRRPTPFHFDMQATCYLHSPEESIDFALIPLRRIYAQSLEANGIVPVSRRNWTGSDQMEFSSYAMLGVPRPPIGSSEITPTMVRIDRIREIPEGIIPPAPDWLMGTVDVEFDLAGMSGGPILGLYRNPDGHTAYRVIAIQSGWFPRPQVILGCPIPRFMALVDAALARARHQGS